MKHPGKTTSESSFLACVTCAQSKEKAMLANLVIYVIK
jgi:hypothetical protein